MNWTRINVTTSHEAVEAVSAIFDDLGATGQAIDDATDYQKLKPGLYGPHGEIVDPAKLPHVKSGAVVSAFLPEKEVTPELVATVKNKVKGLNQFGLNPGAAKVDVVPVNDADWATVWQKYYHPLRVTHDLTIVPQWEDYQRQDDGERLLVLDPGMAFGTGTHPTTQLMLQALEVVIRGGESVIDVGTGSGVLSIAAKILGAGEVSGYDNDPVAIKSAQRNLDLNPAAKGVKLGVNNLLTGIHHPVDLIVANILAEIIEPLVPQAVPNLKDGGHLLLSGIIKDRAQDIAKLVEENGLVVDEQLRMKDWYGFIAHKPIPGVE